MNSFERFSLSVAPLIDRDLLKARYLDEARQLHPDRIQGGVEQKEAAGKDLADLNSAFESLDSPRLRLALLAELMTGKAPARTGRVSGSSADLMMGIAKVCQEVEAVLDRRGKTESALEVAMMSGEIFEATESVSSARAEIARWEQELESELQQLQKDWDAGKRDAKEVERLYQLFSYSEKARKQLEEKFLRLAESLE